MQWLFADLEQTARHFRLGAAVSCVSKWVTCRLTCTQLPDGCSCTYISPSFLSSAKWDIDVGSLPEKLGDVSGLLETIKAFQAVWLHNCSIIIGVQGCFLYNIYYMCRIPPLPPSPSV